MRVEPDQVIPDRVIGHAPSPAVETQISLGVMNVINAKSLKKNVWQEEEEMVEVMVAEAAVEDLEVEEEEETDEAAEALVTEEVEEIAEVEEDLVVVEMIAVVGTTDEVVALEEAEGEEIDEVAVEALGIAVGVGTDEGEVALEEVVGEAVIDEVGDQ